MHYDCLIVDDETAIASSTSEYFNLFELSSAYVTSYEQCIDFLKENTVSFSCWISIWETGPASDSARSCGNRRIFRFCLSAPAPATTIF